MNYKRELHLRRKDRHKKFKVLDVYFIILKQNSFKSKQIDETESIRQKLHISPSNRFITRKKNLLDSGNIRMQHETYRSMLV